MDFKAPSEKAKHPQRTVSGSVASEQNTRISLATAETASGTGAGKSLKRGSQLLPCHLGPKASVKSKRRGRNRGECGGQSSGTVVGRKELPRSYFAGSVTEVDRQLGGNCPSAVQNELPLGVLAES